MTTFDIGRLDEVLGFPLTCDIERLVVSRLLIRADSGGGKSRTLRRILEETHPHIQQFVIDPEGELASLREKFDYVLVAPTGGDCVAHPSTAGPLALKLMELGVSAIIDIYDLPIEERPVFVEKFFEAIINAPKRLWGPRLVALDEAHSFCPKTGEVESSSAVKNLSALGRKRGACPIYATQRIQKLHNDAVAELKNQLVGWTTLDTDVKRAADDLGFPKSRHHEFIELPPGTFFARGPAFSVAGVSRVKVGPVQTTHPEAGQRIGLAPPPPTSAIRALLPQLADLPAEVEEDERATEDLRRENEDLRRQVTELQRRPPTAPPPPPERVPFIPMGVQNALFAAKETLAQVETHLSDEANHITKARRQVQEQIDRLHDKLDEPAVPIVARGTIPDVALAKAMETAQVVHESPPTQHAAPRPRTNGAGVDGYQQDVLDALAKFEALGLGEVDQRQLAALANKSTNSSTWDVKMAALRKAGLITGTGRVRLTDRGRAVARPVEQPKPGELIEAFKRTALDEYQCKLLDVLVASRGRALDKSTLAARAGVSTNSSTWDVKIAPMRKLGIIEYPAPGKVQVSESLFVGGG